MERFNGFLSGRPCFGCFSRLPPVQSCFLLQVLTSQLTPSPAPPKLNSKTRQNESPTPSPSLFLTHTHTHFHIPTHAPHISSLMQTLFVSLPMPARVLTGDAISVLGSLLFAFFETQSPQVDATVLTHWVWTGKPQSTHTKP